MSGVGELTSVSDDDAVVCVGTEQVVHADLTPATTYEIDGHRFTTLARPGGELLTRFAAVNDVHFGETVCGAMDGSDAGVTFTSAPGERPYPEMMNAAAIEDMARMDPEVVIVKGDLTSGGTPGEYERFLAAYGPAFGDRLVHVRGNHDAYTGHDFADEPSQRVELPGVTVAVLDTTRPRAVQGRLTADQLDWLDQLAADADRPVLVFGHHHPWSPDSRTRPDDYFGINPDDSERLVQVIARRPSIRGYFAGHTHRNRVRRFGATGDVAFAEVACVKDFPGAWAEYRVFEGGVCQVFRRISGAEAMAWTEKTRAMFGGAYPEYAFGALSDRCFTIPA